MTPKIKYCPKCGNTGITIDNEPCDCRFNAKSFFESVSCLDIPEQYRGIQFNEMLVPKDVGEGYGKFLQDVYDKVMQNKWKHHNLLIASPIQHSKTILAYSCIEVLFRSGIPTFPVYDVMELYRILMELDLGKQQTYEIEDPMRCLTVPVLFAKIPRIMRWEVFDAITLLVDRRVRRDNSTILLFDGELYQLTKADKNEQLTGMFGDGFYGSIEVKSWGVRGTEKQIIEAENIG